LREIRVAAFHFWPSFRAEELSARFPCLARKYRIVADQERPHIAFFSVFKNGRMTEMPPPPDLGVPAVFLTGEDVMPDMRRCDAAISFRRDISSPRHMRIPNWVHRMHLSGTSPRSLLSEHRPPARRGNRFCLFLYTHRVALREAFCRLLAERKPVDAPGRSLNNMPAIGGGIGDKLALQSQYRFTIAFENARSPGYTTEKLVESFCAGSLPVYWGDPLVHLDFNPDAFLNLADFPSQDSLVEAVLALDENGDSWNERMQRPIYAGDRLPDCADDDRIFAFLEPIFDAALGGRRRGPVGKLLQRLKRHMPDVR
jgi:alpha(1,3/1,4) fucosyltransferase